MNIYIYDGTFEGLLTCIFYGYKETKNINIIKKNKYVRSFIDNNITIPTDLGIFKRVYNSIKDKLSQETLKNVYYLYLSEIYGSEKLIYDYIKLCYKYGDHINLAKNNDIIIEVDKLARRVSLEAHRFKGFIRFSEVAKNIFYSEIEPDYNILPLIIEHFSKRFSDQYFIIHDTKRETAIVYDTKNEYIRELKRSYGQIIKTTSKKDKFESLFKVFYNSVNIKERCNPKQVSKYMPKRYWKNLIEVDKGQ